jgi:hypothetical protein
MERRRFEDIVATGNDGYGGGEQESTQEEEPSEAKVSEEDELGSELFEGNEPSGEKSFSEEGAQAGRRAICGEEVSYLHNTERCSKDFPKESMSRSVQHISNRDA